MQEYPHREQLDPLPPSAKLVYYPRARGATDPEQLATETRLSPRTVRYALRNLKEEEELIESEIYIPDARKEICEIRQ